jgi:hypothetical protein
VQAGPYHGGVADTTKQSIRMPAGRYARVKDRAGPRNAAGAINAFCEAYAEGDPAALELVERWLPVVRASDGHAGQRPVTASA